MEAQFLTAVERPLIIADALTITCDAANQCGRMSLLIEEGRIKDIASEAQLLREEHGDVEVFDAHGYLVTPAFVNAHFHPESILFDDFSRSTPFGVWKLDPVYQKRVERILDPSFIDGLKAVYSVAAMHHVRGGMLTVGTVIPPLTIDVLLPFIEHEMALRLRTRTVLRTWEQIAHGKELKANRVPVAVSIAPDTDFTVYSLDNLARSAQDLDVPIALQVGELKEEAETIRRNFKKSPMTVLRNARLLSPSTQIIHLNHGTAEDLKVAAESRMTLTLCPASASVKRTGYPLLRHLYRHRVPICLGTDWGTGDMMDEMKFVNGLAYLFSNLPEFSPSDILKMATVNGAEALGFGEETGSIERGKQADLIFFGLKPHHMEFIHENPVADDLARLLITRMHGSDIVHVMAGGKPVFHDGQCVHIDEAAVVAQFREIFASLPGASRKIGAEAGRATIIPFMAPTSAHVEEDQGYTVGFSNVPQKTAVPPVVASALQTPQPQTPSKPATPDVPPGRKIKKPELSKNVRLEFGDDDAGPA